MRLITITANMSAVEDSTISPSGISHMLDPMSYWRCHIEQERDDLLQHLEKRPEGQWRSNTLWSFKNEDKVSVAAAPRAVGSHLGAMWTVILGSTCLQAASLPCA